ncbi:5-hydroxymethyl-dUMP N-hydrolase [Austrofundulus limnaeus]|uniref:2'-deoxynucleoside 5'-phosphate N-hydrolase 1 n=1 Tax=Austrofundulus limnaeus TaxID=52670 RepID=A0A2I4AMP7_AUSLI|nr:PREDICTED: 2'-deoxynucleoside 5'-phosphate N-hydrolase 1 [Austrofundulus limnaeus]
MLQRSVLVSCCRHECTWHESLQKKRSTVCGGKRQEVTQSDRKQFCLKRTGGNMQIYFCGSIRGGRDDLQLYRRIVTELQRYGRVLSEHVADADLSDAGEDDPAEGDQAIHDRDVSWLRQSDVVVAEVTQPSLGVGYELGRVVDMKKKVLCLFRPSSGRRLSAMIRGAADGKCFMVKDYNEEDVEKVLEQFFSSLSRT